MTHHETTVLLPACVFRDWNPIVASAPEAAVAAVLAGFVFAGIVVTLSTRTKRHGAAAQALKLLFAAFLGLAVTSYLFANDAGEQTCRRADTLVVVAGGPLGTFSVIMLAALTWLVAAYQTELKDVLKLLRRLIYVSGAFVVLLLCVSSQSYVSAELGKHGPIKLAVISSLIYGVGILGIGLGFLFLLRQQWKRLDRALSALGWKRAAPESQEVDWSARVDRSFYAALSYLGLAGVWAAIVIGIPRSMYRPIHPAFVYVNALVALLAPIPVFVFAALALARHQADDMPKARQAKLAAASDGEGAASEVGRGPAPSRAAPERATRGRRRSNGSRT